MENLQSEIIFIAKFGGILGSLGAYYFWIVKPMAIFNERQKQNRKDIDELKKFEHDFTTLKAEHEMKICNRKKR